MAASDEGQLLEEYRNCRLLYADLARTVSELLERIVSEHRIGLHSVTHRAKDEASLTRKLQRRGCPYGRLGDVTDLAGVRVITYFHDDVDLVAALVQQEFAVDHQNSVDKRALLDPDRFGYLSLHYVVQLSSQRCALAEYKRFMGLSLEIQIRSLLQHVWAEVEHDLGYKSPRSVPSAIRRRFSRLAGLLELADAEFAAIRDALNTYEKEVPALIAAAPASVPIDKVSMAAFLNESEIVNEIDAQIGSLVGAQIVASDPYSVEADLQYLNFVGLTSVAALDNALREQREKIGRFARIWLEGSKYETLARGISVFYLIYVLLALQRDPARIRDWVEKCGVGALNERPSMPDRVLATATKAGIIDAVA
jgi:ppGpp synthetase/RelA/SpoT-type nucleotidyltranferase